MNYRSECHRIASGVCGVKIDDSAKFVKGKNGVGYQIAGFQIAGFQNGRKSDVIIKSKVGKRYVHPKHLDGRKAFYRFYLERDRQGKLRRYVYLAARLDDAPYWGSRVVCMTKNGGTFLILEKSMREKLRHLWIDENGGYQPDESLEEYCEEQWPEHA